MQFCKDCGNALNIFTTGEQELCSQCINLHKKEHHRREASPPASHATSAGLLDETHIEVVDKKIILRSKEGWELWSSPISRATELKTILARATRIYQIRKRREKSEAK